MALNDLHCVDAVEETAHSLTHYLWHKLVVLCYLTVWTLQKCCCTYTTLLRIYVIMSCGTRQGVADHVLLTGCVSAYCVSW